MTTIFYRSNKDNKYYSNKDEICHNVNKICHSCNEINNECYIFFTSISAIFENIKKEIYICKKCYNFKKTIQDEYELKDK
jgi:hypothetical protein